MVMQTFFFQGGRGGVVIKVLSGLCENGEYSWTFSPKTSALIGYFEVTRRLTLKLFPPKVSEQVTLQTIYTYVIDVCN